MATNAPWITELSSTITVHINWVDQQIVLQAPTYRTESVAVPFNREQATKLAAFIKELETNGY